MVEEAGVQAERNELPDLVSLVEVPEWKAILLDLVRSEKMDPWNIDIVDLSRKYLERIRGMNEDNLYVPANALLACAILLNMKADVLRRQYVDGLVGSDHAEAEEPESPGDLAVMGEPEEVFDFPDAGDILGADDLADASAPSTNAVLPPEAILTPARVTTRRVSLEELLVAMERVMRAKKRIPHKKSAPVLDYDVPLEELFEEMDRDAVDRYIEETYSRILETLDSEGMTTLSNISTRGDPLDVVRKLLSLLYLTNQGRIMIWQEQPFDEVFVTVVGNESSENEQPAEPAKDH